MAETGQVAAEMQQVAARDVVSPGNRYLMYAGIAALAGAAALGIWALTQQFKSAKTEEITYPAESQL